MLYTYITKKGVRLMKVEKIDHINLYVNDAEKVAKLFSDIMDIRFLKPLAPDAGYNLTMSFDNKLGFKLSQPTSTDSPIARYIEEHGEGIAAIALKVPNIDEAIAELKAKGIGILRRGESQDTKFAVTDPKNTFGIQFELVEYDSVASIALGALGRLGDLQWR